MATFALLILLTGCQSRRGPELLAWAHAGQESERQVLSRQVNRYNLTHPVHPVKLVFLPEGSYNSQVQAAALAGQLPDVLEFDGPFLYNYIWQRQLTPLPLSRPLLDNLLPSIREQGSYRGRFYAVGLYDSGLGLFVRPSRVRQAGARLPRVPQDAWNLDEFEQLLRNLAGSDPDGAVLDLKRNYQGEWYTYAFAPTFESAGADSLDSPAALSVARRLQSWMKLGYVDANVDDAAFTLGRVALSWAGHWEYHRYAQTWGKDLALAPLPNFGHGSRTGQGSWCWGATRRPQEVADFLSYLLQDEQVLEMARANGAVPSTHSAVARSSLYRPDGPLQLFALQLKDGTSVSRAKTPGYPVYTSVFQSMMLDVLAGAEPARALGRAAWELEQDRRDNRGYP